MTDNLPVQIYTKKMKNRTGFKIKTGYKLELLSPETMRLSRRTKKDDDQDNNREDVLKLESAKVVLVHCNLFNNNFQHASKVLFIFVPITQLLLHLIY